MRRAFIACLLGLMVGLAQPLAAEPPPAGLIAAAPAKNSCDDPACGSPSLATAPTYSQQITRGGDFSVELTLLQPCSCLRRLNLVLTFTSLGGKAARERSFKLDVAQGTSTRKLTITNADLLKARVTPGQYTLSFALFDEHDRLAGSAVAGQPFTFGTTEVALTGKPVVPASIAREGELTVPFKFSNSGDIPVRVTALVVFTRPDQTKGIELYVPNLNVPPGGAKHSVRVPLAKRRELGVGAGAWLITVSAFYGAEQRMASFPGHLLMIGKVLSQPTAPTLSAARIAQAQDLTVTLALKNDGDVEDLVTAVLIFTAPGATKPIEYKLEGIRVPPGASTHPLSVSAIDRYNLGVRPGRWRIATTALDRAGKSLETRRAVDLVIGPEASASATQ